MLRKVSNTSLPLIVYNPTGVFSAEYFSSCADGGSLPVFDTEMFSDDDIIRHIDELEKSGFLFGVKVSVTRENILNQISSRVIPNCDAIVLSYDRIDELKNYRPGRLPYTLFIEVTDIEINELIDGIEPNGLIVKGFEAPGKVSRYTSFILLQWYAEHSSYPVFVHGGVGYFSAAGMFAAGASGIVLDDQLYLTDEAPVSEQIRSLIMKLEESDSQTVTDNTGVKRRFFAKLATKIVRDLKKRVGSGDFDSSADALYNEIKSVYAPVNGTDGEPTQKLFYLGQDAIFAKYFVKDTKKTPEIIRNLFQRINEELSRIEKHDPMIEGSLLAQEHGTRFPIVQGPMANISDNLEFAKMVFEGGALPFFAVGSLPPDIAEKLVQGGKENMNIYGAGMIGVPAFNKFLSEHMEIVKKHNSPFALFAAGNPSQIKELEAAGTKAYLHTPSISMLTNAISAGCTRFIFEGTEAGGHIGNLSSTVLWELALETVNSLGDDEIKKMRLLFAGGIGTPRGSHFVSGMTSSTAMKGCGIGAQISTAYLFTKEIVESGALSSVYQDVMCREHGTIVIGDTVGLQARTVASPFSKRIQENEISRLVENIPLQERKELFEGDNTGSLLVGAKGYELDFSEPGKVKYVDVSENDQYEKGNFMAGDILSCEYGQLTIAEVHDRIINRKETMAKTLNRLETVFSDDGMIKDEIAIIGMGCVYPDALTPDELWQNIISKRYSIGEMAEDRLNRIYYDPDKKAEDKTYTKIAGTVRNFNFDYKKYGFKKEDVATLSFSQKLIIHAAVNAAEDAGMSENGKMTGGDRAAVIIASCLTNELNSDLQFKYYYPEIVSYLDGIDEFRALSEKEKKNLLENLKKGLAHGHEHNDMDGAAVHMESARVASILGIEGINYTIDAACASSLAALDAARKELLTGNYDTVVVGGLNTNLSPESFVGFCKMGALSAEGSFPFDERANGFVLGEGAGAVIVKRMKDAIRDGDRIYAVVRGVGSSSDGKGKAIAAPNPDGQEYALQRCYDSAFSNLKMSDLGYIETHGTSTLMGDLAEIETLKKVYGNIGSRIGLSSIKSQIGHLLGGAGLAGLIKAVQAINNKTLPPNGLFEKLSPRFDLNGTDLYIIKDPSAWETKDGKPRCAAVSSFGFGGINFHCVVSEYNESYVPVDRSELFNLNHDDNDRRVVITGMGVMMPEINSIDELWSTLESGRSILENIPESRFHNSYYVSEKDENYRLPELKAGVLGDSSIDGKQYRMPPTIVKSIDRSQFIGLSCTKQAIEQSGLTGKIDKGNSIAVIIGTTSGDKMLENIIRTRIPYINGIISSSSVPDEKKNAINEKLTAALKAKFHINNEDTVPGLLSNIVSGRIANFFGCNGANFTIDADGASSAAAMRVAFMGIQSGDYDFAITGGIDSSITPGWFHRLKRNGLVASGISSIFDSKTGGANLSEGGALFIMTSYKKAVENNLPILAELESISVSGISAEKDKTSSPYKKAMEEVYETAAIASRQVNYIDVHGVSATDANLSEYNVLNGVFRSGTEFGSSAPELGYFKSASTAVSIAKMILMNSNGKILPVKSFDAEKSLVSGDSGIRPVTSVKDISSLPQKHYAADITGTGGLSGHALVGTLPLALASSRRKTSAVAPQVQPVSAVIPKTGFTETAGSMATALLSGQGAQHAGMMKELYENNEVIRATLNRGNEIFKAARGYSILDMMFGDDKAINSTENTQPAIFISTAAVYDALSREGFNPKYFIGHSLGECSALYCSGMLDFEQALNLIMTRSTLMKEAANKIAGEIMVVFKPWRETDDLIKASGLRDIYVTNKNSDSQTVVAGTPASVGAFIEKLKGADIMYKKLPLSGAFHTPLFNSASEGLRKYLAGIKFNNTDFTRVISNVTAQPYPQDEAQVKELLAKQVISPVEFIDSVKFAGSNGGNSFVEVGPASILTNLLKSISITPALSIPTVDQKKGQQAAFDAAKSAISAAPAKIESPAVAKTASALPVQTVPAAKAAPVQFDAASVSDKGFSEFLKEKKSDVEKILYEEYKKFKMMKELEEREKYDFYAGSVVVSGVSVGLPGKSRKVFEDDNIDSILKGENRIETLTNEFLQHQIKKNITKLKKKPDGSATMQEIKSDDEVIHLAGQLGFFDRLEYGIEFDNDRADALAMAAGIEALRDAGIPLVPQMKKTSTGSYLFDGYALPEEMQDTTGVIRTSVFSGFDAIIEEVAKYTTYLNVNGPLKLFENLYYYIMEKVQDEEVKRRITEWFFELKKQGGDREYEFNRGFILKMGYMGAPQFAQLIKAKGPNTQSNAACASVTQGIAMAEDWIRTGRCERVVVIGSEVTDPERLGQWLHAGFLAMGAATIKKNVFDAAKPFDAERNGTIIGAGAAGIVVERADLVNRRGRNGQAEILGTVFGNSAFHGTRINVSHIAEVMKKLVDRAERVHSLDKNEYTKSMIFMSHETFTPAVGGSAQAEIDAIKGSYPEHYRNILITNTKGFTGHTLGGGLEDPVMIKAMQLGMAPPIANLNKVPAEFKDLNFSRGARGTYNYGLHFAAGFGSHFALLFTRRLEETPVDNPIYQQWLRDISGYDNPELVLIKKTLCIKAQDKVMPKGKPAVAVPSVAKPAASVQAPAAQPVAAPAAVQTGPDLSSIKNEIKKVIAAQTGYTVDMLDDGLDMEADLGIDTVKQVEIFGKISSQFSLEVPEDLKLSNMNTIEKLVEYIASKVKVSAPAAAVSAPAMTTAPAASGGHDMSVIVNTIKKVIAAQTGYTVDMLEDGLDLEADLGIDTVKQVEIFGKISSEFSLDVPEDLKLSDMNTIEKLVQYIASKVKVSAPATAVSAPAMTSAPAASGGQDMSVIVNTIKQVIANQTGYTVDMLEDGLDLEADLGIDTVKQVEIFGKISSEFSLDVPEDLKLSDMNTIEKLVQYIASKVKVSAPAAAVSAPAMTSAPASSGVDINTIKAGIKDVIAEQTGYTTDMLEDGLDLEADLGIDTVKQVEIFGKVSSKFSLEVPEDLKLSDMNTIEKLVQYIASKVAVSAPAAAVYAAPAMTSAPASSGVDISTIKAGIKDVIAEQTGYTTDMLEDGLDLEADLGIDTVKQVEIFGKVSSKFSLEVPEDLKLSDMNTIEKLVQYIASKVAASAPAAVSVAPVMTSAPASSGVDISTIKAGIKDVIAEQTGYTTDMLEDGLDLEADLGIDTVKQVEIFGKVSSKFSLEVPEDLKLSDMNTIEKLVQYIASKVAASAPAAVSVAPVMTSAPASSGVDISTIKTGIKDVIAEQTGYTTDMLEDGLDLEADLGIDTVKQVEIFGKVSSKFSLEVPEDLKLSDMNTIEKLVQYIASKVNAASAPAAATVAAVAGAVQAGNIRNDGIHRFTLSTTKLPDLKKTGGDFSGKTFLVSVDSQGYSDRIIQNIKKSGGSVLTIGGGKSDCKAEMTDPAAVEKALSDFYQKHPEINSFIHLSPIDYIVSGAHTTEKAIESSIKSFFIIIRMLHESLRKKGSIVAALSFNSVVFPYSEDGRGEIYPISGSIAGMLKTINKEFTDATVKAVDFSIDNPKKNVNETADAFVNELLSGDKRVEIGYRDGSRYGMILSDEWAKKEQPLINDGSTVLVTGGAGGITFEILKRYAKEYKDLKLIIFDITDIDSISSEFLPDSVNEEFIISSLRNTMKGAKPLEIKNAASAVMRAKRAASNMNVLRGLGVTVDYHRVDVNSADSVAKALKNYKKIDGVLHAAGMEESQIIEKMTFESFNRVYNVKAYGTLNLLAALSKIEYTFFAAFSSVAARFGNEGQLNYSGGNEMLAKILFRERAANKKRFYKICDWTAWEGAGMATNETVNKVLKERGMTFLPLDQGIQLFMDEMNDNTAVESLFTGMDKSFDKDGILPGNSSETVAPFLDSRTGSNGSRLTFLRTLELERDLFISDHAKDGIPLFLGATGIETMAEAASELHGRNRSLKELRDFQIPYSIKILKGRPKEIITEAVKTGKDGEFRCTITSLFKNPKGVVVGEPTLHYEGTYVFGDPGKQPVIEVPAKSRVETDGDFQQIIYHPERLFMDGVFRTVQGIHYFDKELLVCSVRHAPEREFFAGDTSPEFITDVVLIDAMFQTGGIFEMLTTSDIILPSKIDRMVFYKAPRKDEEYLCFTRKTGSGAESNSFSLTLADYQGNVYIEIDRFDMVKVTRVPLEDRIDNKFRITQ